MAAERCPNCYGRLAGQSQLMHETSGRCRAREYDMPHNVIPIRRAPHAGGRRAPVPDGLRRRAVEAPHGTESRYSSKKWACRCIECTAAHAAYNWDRDQIKRRNTKPPEHGTRSRYTSKKWACRCAECTAAETAYAAALRELKRTRGQHADVG